MKIMAKISPMTYITITSHKKTTRAKLYRKFVVCAVQYGYHDREIRNAVIEFE